MPERGVPSALPGGSPDLAASMHWVWFRATVCERLRSSAHLPLSSEVDPSAVARAFWNWVSVMEREGTYAAVDARDYCQFGAGVLLHMFLAAAPICHPPLPREDECRAVMEVVLGLLAEWQGAQGTPPGITLEQVLAAPQWPEFLQDTRDSTRFAIPYLDLFCGLEPVWEFPMLSFERPAMRAAVAARTAPARGHDGN